MSNNRNIDILTKIIQYCGEIQGTIDRFGNSLDALKSDFVYKNAVAMCVLQIGELTNHLSDDFKATYKEMPWRAIRGMRNIAAHQYGDFDIETLWGTITKNIPSLREYCEDIIRQYEVLEQDAIKTPDEDTEPANEPDEDM